MANEKVEVQETSETPVEVETPETPAESVEEPVVEVDPALAKEALEQNPHLYARAKKAEAEAKELKEKIKEIEQPELSDIDTDEGVKEDVEELKGKLATFERDKELDKAYKQWPVLATNIEEFDKFLEEHPDKGISSAAKEFLVDNELLAQPRKGLEKPTGGARVAPSTGKMTAEDLGRLRETNYDEYMKLVKSGGAQITE